MRAPALQYLYLQRPLTLLLLITVLSVLCWISAGEFYTKGEPREAAVAVSMVEQNNWILPRGYADELAYKPPLTHWLMAVFSLPQGEVTPFTSRLPSAICFMGLIGCCFVFFGKRLRFTEAFLTCLILLTSFELHRAAMTARVDMLLTFLTVLSLMFLFKWEERKKIKGLPILTSLLLGLATLTKGPVGIVLPLLVFGIYLLVLQYNYRRIICKSIAIALIAMILPGIWYCLAYLSGGKEFFDLVWAENVGRFLGSDKLNINYNLGHEEPVWYNLITLMTGFIPWTIVLLISLFCISYSFKIPKIRQVKQYLLDLPRIKLFSLISALVILIFYSIPISKRSVYLMPAYPFIAVFIAQYVLYITDYKPFVNKTFSWIVGILGIIIALFSLLTAVTGLVNPVDIVRFFTKHAKTLSDVDIIRQFFYSPPVLYSILIGVLVASLFILFYQLRRNSKLKLLYATIGTFLAINLVADGIYLPAFKNGISIKPFAQELEKNYPVKEKNIYVMNNLLEYSNMYGINFYLHNSFLNFEKEIPAEGFLLVGELSFQKVKQRYGKNYDFSLLTQTQSRCRDGEGINQFYSFKRKR